MFNYIFRKSSIPILQLHYRLVNKKRPPQFLEAAPIVKRIKLQIT